MVCARLPQDIKPFHLFETTEDVLKGIVQGVAHVKGPGDIGGWNHDAIGVLFRGGFWFKETVVFPVFVPFLLNTLRFVTLCN